MSRKYKKTIKDDINEQTKKDSSVVVNSNIPVKEKFGLTVEEAAQYFSIGKTRLYEFIHENPDCKFLLRNKSKFIIKREQFEAFLNEQTDLWNLQ